MKHRAPLIHVIIFVIGLSLANSCDKEPSSCDKCGVIGEWEAIFTNDSERIELELEFDDDGDFELAFFYDNDRTSYRGEWEYTQSDCKKIEAVYVDDFGDEYELEFEIETCGEDNQIITGELTVIYDNDPNEWDFVAER